MLNIKRYLLVFAGLISFNLEAQIVFNNGGVMKLNGGSSGTPIYIVLGGTSIPATPITVNTSGGIVSDNEYHKLRYRLGTGTTTINVPFIRGTGAFSVANTVGVSMAVTSAGTGSNYIDFSNKAAATTATGWDNSAYMPSMVTHMSQVTSPGTNGSDYAIDRFWIIDASSYGASKPATTFTFTYLDDELAANTSAGSNTITEANLQAQRFNETSSIWGDFLSGTQSGQTVSVTVSAANFFKAWTLSDNTNPLPITLLTANANCNNGQVLITWSTAVEINNSYFSIEKSSDGISFTVIGNIQGAGNSSSVNNYQYTDTDNSGLTYYRIRQTDFNGDYKYSEIFSVDCGSKADFQFVNATNATPGQLSLFTSSSEEEIRNVRLVNTLGQLIYESKKTFNAGFNQLSINTQSLASGIYYISLTNEKSSLVKKVYIE